MSSNDSNLLFLIKKTGRTVSMQTNFKSKAGFLFMDTGDQFYLSRLNYVVNIGQYC